MKIIKDGWPWIIGSFLLPLAVACLFLVREATVPAGLLFGLAVVLGGFMVYFFRDPDRVVDPNPDEIVSGADGVVRAIETVPENRFMKTEAVRVSVFLSPMDVHVNRSPLSGTVAGLDYTPGRHILTIKNEASEYNEHSSIYIEGAKTRCLVKQIVGPLVRRVVYWLDADQQIGKGDRIGMMKFGSRMDVYLPQADVDVCVEQGDTVLAGQTVLARVKKDLR